MAWHVQPAVEHLGEVPVNRVLNHGGKVGGGMLGASLSVADASNPFFGGLISVSAFLVGMDFVKNR